MTWPTSADYYDAVQNLGQTIGDPELREGQVAFTPLGLPMPWSGQFADVYRIHSLRTGNTWALKFFKREVPGQADRYRHIAAHLEQVRLPFMLDFQYLEQGVRIGGAWFPVLKMRWVEGGIPLNTFVESHLHRPRMLRDLLGLWVKVARYLCQAQIAHADLHHGNVLLVPHGNGSLALRLIDYDGMYIPALAGTHSGELGHRAYQHPQRRRDRVYSAEVDRFSHLAIYCAIHCLTVDRRLWRFDNGDNLLFREQDFDEPAASAVFQTLWQLPDGGCRALAGRLILACTQELHEVPLLDEVTNGQVLPLTPAEERAVNAVLEMDTRFVRPTLLEPQEVVPVVSPLATTVPVISPPAADEQVAETKDMPFVKVTESHTPHVRRGTVTPLAIMRRFTQGCAQTNGAKQVCRTAAAVTVVVATLVVVVGWLSHGDPPRRAPGKSRSVIQRSARSGTPAPVAESIAKPQSTDVLRQLVMSRTVAGSWRYVDGIWEGSGDWARIEAGPLPEKYVVEATVHRTEGTGGFALGVSVGDAQCMVIIDGRHSWYKEGKVPISGIDMLDGTTVGANSSTREGAVFVNGVDRTIRCRVTGHHLEVTCDDEKIVNWTGDPSRLMQRPEWHVPMTKTLYLGVYFSTFRIRSCVLKPGS